MSPDKAKVLEALKKNERVYFFLTDEEKQLLDEVPADSTKCLGYRTEGHTLEAIGFLRHRGQPLSDCLVWRIDQDYQLPEPSGWHVVEREDTNPKEFYRAIKALGPSIVGGVQYEGQKDYQVWYMRTKAFIDTHGLIIQSSKRDVKPAQIARFRYWKGEL